MMPIGVGLVFSVLAALFSRALMIQFGPWLLMMPLVLWVVALVQELRRSGLASLDFEVFMAGLIWLVLAAIGKGAVD